MKRVIYKKLLLPAMVTAMMLIASCSLHDIEENHPDIFGNGGDIRFEINIAAQTRVATDLKFKSTWDYGDAIGVFAVRRPSGTAATLTTSENFIQNVKLSYNSVKDTWTASEELWWPGNSDKLDFYAYYPYNAQATDPTHIAFNVMNDQSGRTNGIPNYNRLDLLSAKADNNGNGYGKGETVSLVFSHALAMIQVSIPAIGKGIGPSETMSVILNGAKLKSTLNLGDTNGPEAELVENDNPVEKIKMFRVENDIYGSTNYYNSYTYRALIPAQDIKPSDNLFLITNEGQMYQGGSGSADNLTLKAGTAETFTRSIPNTLHTVEIKAGTFLMGSPADEPEHDVTNEQQHKVTLSKNFRMSKYNITNAQYAEFLNSIKVGEDGMYKTRDYDQQRLILPNDTWGVIWENGKWEPNIHTPDNPVVRVTWYGANEYARWTGGALPTEAQWEYARRSGLTTAYSCPDYDNNNTIDEDDLTLYTWCKLNSANFPHEIGRLEPSPWGLYDMYGNVSEWCSDWYDSSYGLTQDQIKNGVTDPTGAASGSYRSIRGAHYASEPKDCRAAYRYYKSPDQHQYYIGFRIVFNQ